ncbi:hypothetical protein [Kineococcus auxinigenes]|uniref:hypothetical protein n=1 Tax=unclassified Kineococcus TaxID=2621656 RepID=UPI003D7D0776
MRRLSTASTSTVSRAVGAAALAGGAWAWALAATAMSAVHAAEARALGPGHTPDMPGEDELALAAHDVRLAAMAAMWCALPLLLARPSALPRRTGPGGRRTAAPFAAWAGAGVAIALANALLGPTVDTRPPALAAVLVLAAVAAGTAAGAAAGSALHRGPAPSEGALWWWLTGSGALAAGTAWAALAQDLNSERYAAFLPRQVPDANAVAVLVLLATSGAGALAAGSISERASGRVRRNAHPLLRAALVVVPTTVAAVLMLDPTGLLPDAWSDTWRTGPALVAALAPLFLIAGPGLRAPSRRRVSTTALVLVAVAALSTVALPLLAPVVLVGGVLGLVFTAPAGAYIGYDGLPMTGAGGLLALGALVVLVVLTGERDGQEAPAPQRSPV